MNRWSWLVVVAVTTVLAGPAANATEPLCSNPPTSELQQLARIVSGGEQWDEDTTCRVRLIRIAGLDIDVVYCPAEKTGAPSMAFWYKAVGAPRDRQRVTKDHCLDGSVNYGASLEEGTQTYMNFLPDPYDVADASITYPDLPPVHGPEFKPYWQRDHNRTLALVFGALRHIR